MSTVPVFMVYGLSELICPNSKGGQVLSNVESIDHLQLMREQRLPRFGTEKPRIITVCAPIGWKWLILEIL